GGQSIGETTNQLTNIVNNIHNNNQSKINDLKDVKISLNDKSRVMNTELLNAIQIKSMLPIVEAISKSG
ncbi:MAG: hypothetical protein ACPHK7_04360, partial [Candidatus Thalassarchaeaceae archaeon]